MAHPALITSMIIQNTVMWKECIQVTERRTCRAYSSGFDLSCDCCNNRRLCALQAPTEQQHGSWSSSRARSSTCSCASVRPSDKTAAVRALERSFPVKQVQDRAVFTLAPALLSLALIFSRIVMSSFKSDQLQLWACYDADSRKGSYQKS